MTTTQRIQKFTQSVYLIRYNRYLDSVTDADGLAEIAKTIDWTNQLIDELEVEADWNFVRDNDLTIGTISSATQTFELPDDVRKLVVNEHRPLRIYQDGSPVSTWDVVPPNLITNSHDINPRDRVTVVKKTIIFSRALKDSEIGGTVVADVINYIPRLSDTNVDVFDTVTPYQLLILGVAKNAALPDIVQGGLSPSFVQKYADLLTQSKAENDASAAAEMVLREDNSSIGGIY